MNRSEKKAKKALKRKLKRKESLRAKRYGEWRESLTRPEKPKVSVKRGVAHSAVKPVHQDPTMGTAADINRSAWGFKDGEDSQTA